MTTYMKTYGNSRLLSGNLVDAPTRLTDETEFAFASRQKEWEGRQEKCMGTVEYYVGATALELIKDVRTVKAAFDILERRFKPVGSALFQDLICRYDALTLASCESVAAFSEQLKKLAEELEALDKSLNCTHGVDGVMAHLGVDPRG